MMISSSSSIRDQDNGNTVTTDSIDEEFSQQQQQQQPQPQQQQFNSSSSIIPSRRTDDKNLAQRLSASSTEEEEEEDNEMDGECLEVVSEGETPSVPSSLSSTSSSSTTTTRRKDRSITTTTTTTTTTITNRKRKLSLSPIHTVHDSAYNFETSNNNNNNNQNNNNNNNSSSSSRATNNGFGKRSNSSSLPSSSRTTRKSHNNHKNRNNNNNNNNTSDSSDDYDDSLHRQSSLPHISQTQQRSQSYSSLPSISSFFSSSSSSPSSASSSSSSSLPPSCSSPDTPEIPDHMTFSMAVDKFNLHSMNEYTIWARGLVCVLGLSTILILKLMEDDWKLHFRTFVFILYAISYVRMHFFISELSVVSGQFLYEHDHSSSGSSSNKQSTSKRRLSRSMEERNTKRRKKSNTYTHDPLHSLMIKLCTLLSKYKLLLFGSIFLTVEVIRAVWVLGSMIIIYLLLGVNTPAYVLSVMYQIVSVMCIELVSDQPFMSTAAASFNIVGVITIMLCMGCPVSTVICVTFTLIAIHILCRSMMRFMKIITSFAAYNEKQMGLVRSERLYRQLYTNAPTLFITINAGGKITNTNKATCDLTGYTYDELLQQQMYQLFDEKSNQLFMNICDISDHKQDNVQNIEMKVITKSGQVKDVLMGASFIRNRETRDIESGNIVLYDISQTKAIQKELELAKERAEASSKAKSSFVNTISHEIRTPAFAISALTEVMLLAGNLNSEQVELMQTIKGSAELLRTIISDILDLAKVEQDTFELEQSPFDLQQVLYTIKKSIFDTIAKGKNLSYRISLDANTPTHLVGDMTRLIQILINLTNNAIKFTDKGHVNLYVSTTDPNSISDHLDQSIVDSITQEAENNPIDEKTHTRLLFVVEDSGIGIPNERFPELFKSFSQLTRSHGGTGLGLCISKGLVERMKGHIYVSSGGLGAGSTFYFTAVFALQVEQSLQSNTRDHLCPRVTTSWPNLRVLLVEDNIINTKLIVRMLTQCGLKLENIDTAANGKIACQKFMEKHYLPDAGLHYEMVLMDINMPVMDGYEATRYIREYDARIPIVALTADASRECKDLCLAAGMNQIVTKPFTMHQIQQLLSDFAHAHHG